ncbi:MAG: 2-(3-amino-3-carboxypropyl)histidine synthase subunit [Nanoarchaeota archaeon]|nr:2-(3-amino-3-carboxypropyl)histidine synthase subunit [Nanoarchaeota archaeon]
MKTLYLEARKKNLDLPSYDFSKLPKKVGLLYTIQFKPFMQEIKDALEKEGKEVILGQGARAKHKGQVLGCDAGAAICIIDKVGCFLFVSSGKWHAKRIVLSLPKQKPFFMLSGNGLESIGAEDLKKSRLALQKKFYFAERFGILVSTKPGQENMKDAIVLKEKLERAGKKAFIFISDMIDSSEFENFKIDLWINTACPGLAFDFPNTINLEEIKELEF